MNLAIIQARMSSTRLPGKVLRPILGRPMLGRHLDRLRRARRIDRLVLATSREPSDDPIAAFGKSESVPVYRGSLNDVLDRFHGALEEFGPADNVIRLTADCPLADWRVIDACVDLHEREEGDYTSNAIKRTFPDGLDVEVMKSAALERAFAEARAGDEREHVTAYIYRHPGLFHLVHLVQPRDLGALRWTVDTPADFAMVSAVYAALLESEPDFSQQDVLDLLARAPEIAALNDPTRT
jgi:spore coat polysaccharide biosynthesis protein SpsF